MNGVTTNGGPGAVREVTDEVRRSVGLCVTSPVTYLMWRVSEGYWHFLPLSPKKLYSEYERVKATMTLIFIFIPTRS